MNPLLFAALAAVGVTLLALSGGSSSAPARQDDLPPRPLPDRTPAGPRPSPSPSPPALELLPVPATGGAMRPDDVLALLQRADGSLLQSLDIRPDSVRLTSVLQGALEAIPALPLAIAIDRVSLLARRLQGLAIDTPPPDRTVQELTQIWRSASASPALMRDTLSSFLDGLRQERGLLTEAETTLLANGQADLVQTALDDILALLSVCVQGLQGPWPEWAEAVAAAMAMATALPPDSDAVAQPSPEDGYEQVTSLDWWMDLLAQRARDLPDLLGHWPADADPPWGVEVISMEFRGARYDVVTVDLRQAQLLLRGQQPGDPRRPADLPSGEVLMATNAGIFHTPDQPVGLFIQDGVQTHPINRDAGEGNFFMMPNGVFAVSGQVATVLSTEEWPDDLEGNGGIPDLATQSGPLLVHQGRLHPDFKAGSANVKIRSGVGVVHGATSPLVRFVISRDQVNFHDFASLFLEKLSCFDALYLDGEISFLDAPGLPPSYSAMRWERTSALDVGPFAGLILAVPR